MSSAKKQVAALAGILGFTAAFGGLSYGIRAVGTSVYVDGACTARCKDVHLAYTGIEYRMGKQDHVSMCECSGVRVPSPEAETVGEVSVLVPIGLAFVVTGGFLFWLSRRAKT